MVLAPAPIHWRTEEHVARSSAVEPRIVVMVGLTNFPRELGRFQVRFAAATPPMNGDLPRKVSLGIFPVIERGGRFRLDIHIGRAVRHVPPAHDLSAREIDRGIPFHPAFIGANKVKPPGQARRTIQRA
jgi:hypothetical protein